MDAYVSDRRYARHLTPIVEELADRGHRIGLYSGPSIPPSNLVLVASGADSKAMRSLRKQVIYVEHGAGQSYHGERAHHAYAGGSGHDHAKLFISPNETTANLWRSRYDVPSVAVGCPALDRVHTDPPRRTATVAAVFHWRCNVAVESGTAFDEFVDHLPAVADVAEQHSRQFVVHLHPRWDSHTVRWVKDRYRWASYDDVLAADLLIADNTSAIPEFASLNKPVIMVNSPTWRRWIDHGGRFWDWERGQPVADRGPDLADIVATVLTDPSGYVNGRETMVRSVYAHTDGKASRRAADAIESLL